MGKRNYSHPTPLPEGERVFSFNFGVEKSVL